MEATPAVTAADVVQWFVEAGFAPPPTEAMLGAFVGYIGLAAICAPPPGQQWERVQEELDAFDAVKVLCRVLPALVESANSDAEAARKEYGRTSGALRLVACESRAAHLRALNMAVKAASRSFSRSLRPGKRVADWHGTAEGIAAHISAALRQAGHPEPKFTSHKGPASKVLQRALAKIEGFERKLTQIVEPFRSGR